MSLTYKTVYEIRGCPGFSFEATRTESEDDARAPSDFDVLFCVGGSQGDDTTLTLEGSATSMVQWFSSMVESVDREAKRLVQAGKLYGPWKPSRPSSSQSPDLSYFLTRVAEREKKVKMLLASGDPEEGSPERSHWYKGYLAGMKDAVAMSREGSPVRVTSPTSGRRTSTRGKKGKKGKGKR